MAFSSVQFLFVFLPLSLAVYWLCPKWLRNAVLAAFSLLFFAWAGLKGAAILVLLAGINWLGGLSLGRLAHKRPLLILLILLDLALRRRRSTPLCRVCCRCSPPPCRWG